MLKHNLHVSCRFRPVEALAAIPAWAARLAFGRMADEMLLAGARVIPQRLIETGYEFRHNELEPALKDLLRL